MNRPTYRELDKRLSEAQDAINREMVNLVNPQALASDALELGYRIEDELFDSLSSVLAGISPANYAGKRPPALSYEHIIMANALYAFRADSESFNCQVYLKFTVFDNELWVVSFHKNRTTKKAGRL